MYSNSCFNPTPDLTVSRPWISGKPNRFRSNLKRLINGSPRVTSSESLSDSLKKSQYSSFYIPQERSSDPSFPLRPEGCLCHISCVFHFDYFISSEFVIN